MPHQGLEWQIGATSHGRQTRYATDPPRGFDGTTVSTVSTAREEWVNRLKLPGSHVFRTMLTVASKLQTGTS